MNFLSKVKKYKSIEIKRLEFRQSENSFAKLFYPYRKKPVLIGEIKPRTPSGEILYSGDFLKLARTYENAGVDAISILTDEKSFGGSINLLNEISRIVKVPILRKDFIISKAQIIESVENKANAILLIVKLLKQEKLKMLIEFSYELKLLPIIEVTNTREISRAVSAGAKIIGVNSRDLQTLEINFDKALKTLRCVPGQIVPLLFSGVCTRENVKDAVENGAKGILIGSGLIKSKNIKHKIKELMYDKK